MLEIQKERGRIRERDRGLEIQRGRRSGELTCSAKPALVVGGRSLPRLCLSCLFRVSFYCCFSQGSSEIESGDWRVEKAKRTEKSPPKKI